MSSESTPTTAVTAVNSNTSRFQITCLPVLGHDAGAASLLPSVATARREDMPVKSAPRDSVRLVGHEDVHGCDSTIRSLSPMTPPGPGVSESADRSSSCRCATVTKFSYHARAGQERRRQGHGKSGGLAVARLTPQVPAGQRGIGIISMYHDHVVGVGSSES